MSRWKITLTIFLFVFRGGISSILHGSHAYAYSEPSSYYFLANGHFFIIKPEQQSLSCLGSFHYAAPTIALSPDGLYWARWGEKTLAAFNPKSGKIEAKVTLPHRPYNHIIADNGKAYVTHHTLTARGFWISVADTSQKKLVKIIKDIWGLRTGLAYGHGFVYLAAIGVGRPDNLYLYQINSQNDRLKEIYRVPKTDYSWKISVLGNSLYLCHLNMPDKSLAPMIEIMDLERKKIIQTLNTSKLKGVKKILGKITFYGKRGFFPCLRTDGHYGLALFNPQLGRVEKVFKVISPIHKIIGLRDDFLFYIDTPAGAGKKEISLYFYNLNLGKEVKVISTAKFLKGKQKILKDGKL